MHWACGQGSLRAFSWHSWYLHGCPANSLGPGCTLPLRLAAPCSPGSHGRRKRMLVSTNSCKGRGGIGGSSPIARCLGPSSHLHLLLSPPLQGGQVGAQAVQVRGLPDQDVSASVRTCVPGVLTWPLAHQFRSLVHHRAATASNVGACGQARGSSRPFLRSSSYTRIHRFFVLMGPAAAPPLGARAMK